MISPKQAWTAGSADRRLRRRAASAVPALSRRQTACRGRVSGNDGEGVARTAGFSRGERRKDVAVPHRGEYLPRYAPKRLDADAQKQRAAGGHAGAGRQEDGHLRELTASVLALPGKYREIIVLFYYKQMKIREIAEALHMPTASVSSRLRRARAMLKIDMEGGKDA